MSVGEKLDNLSSWWNKIQEVGPVFGYFSNAQKSWLLVKEEFLSGADRVFCWIRGQHDNAREKIPWSTSGYNFFQRVCHCC